MSRLSFRLLFIYLLLSFFSVVTAETVLIDRIAADVNGGIITYRDVAVELLLDLGKEDEEKALQNLIDRILLLREAEKFKITESKEDVEKIEGRLEEIRSYMGTERYESFLMDYNLTRDDILMRLTERFIAEKFINFRINFFIVISEEAIKSFYEEQKDEFGDRTISEVHDHIKKRLFSIESEKRLSAYLKSLRSRARIIINQ